MKCDHERLSPKGSIVRWSYNTTDGSEWRWFLGCRYCGKVVNGGMVVLKRKGQQCGSTSQAQ